MILTAMVLFEFIDGASRYVPPPNAGFGGSNTVGPFWAFDGFSAAGTPPAVTEQRQVLFLNDVCGLMNL